MVQWVGGGAPHLTLIPRKPTPLGIMFKTVCCGSTGVLLNAELQECAEDMHKKEYYAKWGSTTACTLRLVKPYFSLKKIVVADSWFGSTKCLYALREQGLHGIMNVKTGHKGFPKKILLDKAVNRGDVYGMDVTIAG